MHVCLRESIGQPGLMGRLDPSPAIAAMVGSNSLSEWEVSNSLVLACLTLRGFETQGVGLQGPTWLPRLELEDRTGCSTGSHFSELEVQKGHPQWRPVFIMALRVQRMRERQEGRHLGQQSHKPCPYYIWSGTTDTSATFCLSPGLSLHCPGDLSIGPCPSLHRQLEPKPETAQALTSSHEAKLLVALVGCAQTRARGEAQPQCVPSQQHQSRDRFFRQERVKRKKGWEMSTWEYIPTASSCAGKK